MKKNYFIVETWFGSLVCMKRNTYTLEENGVFASNKSMPLHYPNLKTEMQKESYFVDLKFY